MEREILETFGYHLKKIRKRKGLSQEDLAFACGLDRTYISGIERGKRNVSLINICKISRSLELEPYQLLLFKEDVG